MKNAIKRVVILGGGMAGHKLAYDLQGEAQVTLVDPKDYFEIPMAAPRLMSEPGAVPSIIRFSEFLPTTTIIRGWVEGVSATHVEVSDVEGGARRDIPFDVLVIATGANYGNDLFRPEAGSASEREGHYQSFHDKIAAAHSILIVGGGAIGVELAGEMVQDHPEKTVTLVDMAPEILGRTSPKLRKWAKDRLEKGGVRFILGDSLATPAFPAKGYIDEPGVAVTGKGETIPYDLAIFALGTKPSAEYMKPHFAAALSPKGEIMVEPTLQVKGTRNIFALGDVADLPVKGALWAQLQTPVAVANIRQVLAGEPADKLKPFKQAISSDTMIVTLGRQGGVAHLPFGKFKAGFLARALKAKDMLVGRTRKGIGL